MAYGVRDTVKCDKVNNGYNNNKGLFRPCQLHSPSLQFPFFFSKKKEKKYKKKENVSIALKVYASYGLYI